MNPDHVMLSTKKQTTATSLKWNIVSAYAPVSLEQATPVGFPGKGILSTATPAMINPTIHCYVYASTMSIYGSTMSTATPTMINPTIHCYVCGSIMSTATPAMINPTTHHHVYGSTMSTATPAMINPTTHHYVYGSTMSTATPAMINPAIHCNVCGIVYVHCHIIMHWSTQQYTVMSMVTGSTVMPMVVLLCLSWYYVHCHSSNDQPNNTLNHLIGPQSL